MSKSTVLVAEDDASIRLIVNQTLLSAGFDVRATGSPDVLERWIRDGEGDVVLTDVYLGSVSVFDLLPSFKLQRPDVPFIVMSGQNTILTAAAAARNGAFDYIPKPFDIEHLTKIVQQAALEDEVNETKRQLKPATRIANETARLPLIGRSTVMQEVYRVMTKVMTSNLTVLIEGESGTGKELAAKAIHDLGETGGEFECLHLAKLSPESLESKFINQSSETDGTLYLDEVGDLPLPAQTRLIEILRQNETKRIIASTRVDLSSLVDSGSFREDLYYRLNVVRLKMPPLRERKEDIPDLVSAFLLRSQQAGASKTLNPDAIELLKAYDWPGNVRELENLILRLAVLSPHSKISVQDVTRELRQGAASMAESSTGLEEDMRKLLHRYVMSDLISESGDDTHTSVMNCVERPLIELALSVTSGNKLKAAKLLGMNRNTLRARMNVLEIQ